MKLERFEIIDRCLFWKKRKILIAGDLHLGYEANLNEEGISVPRTQFEETSRIFERVFKKCGKLNKIILLGDIKHYFSGILRQEFDDFKKLIVILERNLRKNGEIIIIKGNHDNILEPIITHFRNIYLKESYLIEDVQFLHGDFLEFKNLKSFELNKRTKLIIVGHFHPAFILDDGTKTEKYKCFLYGKIKEIKKEVTILPSFFPLIEGSDIFSEINWKIDVSKLRIFAIDENGEVYEFGEIKDKIIFALFH